MTEWIKSYVLYQKAWTTELYSIQIGYQFDFTPGQFIQLALEESATIYRPYSLVNLPTEKLEIYYKKVVGGQFSTQLAELKCGDPIWLGPIRGRFCIDSVASSNQLWLMASGTGLGVFLCFLKTNTIWQRFKQITLIHSVSAAEHLVYQELIKQLQDNYPKQFVWLPIITQTMVRLPQQIINQQLILSPVDSQVMLCGNPQFIQATICALINQGFDKAQIILENYWKT